MRVLFVFAIPRTGSSFLNGLLKSCPEINAKSELFHGRTLSRFSRAEDAAMERAANGASIEGRKANRWRKQNPAKTLDTLYEAGGKRIVAIKVFSNHLSRDMLQSEILARDDIVFAVLRRRPIECFISGMKANSLDKFARVDTTDIKPTLNADHFLEWAAAMRDWYVWVNAQLKARD